MVVTVYFYWHRISDPYMSTPNQPIISKKRPPHKYYIPSFCKFISKVKVYHHTTSTYGGVIDIIQLSAFFLSCSHALVAPPSQPSLRLKLS